MLLATLRRACATTFKLATVVEDASVVGWWQSTEPRYHQLLLGVFMVRVVITASNENSLRPGVFPEGCVR